MRISRIPIDKPGRCPKVSLAFGRSAEERSKVRDYTAHQSVPGLPLRGHKQSRALIVTYPATLEIVLSGPHRASLLKRAEPMPMAQQRSFLVTSANREEF